MSNRDDTPRGDGNSQPAACTCGEPKGAHYDDCALLAARREQRHRECDAHQCPWCPDATRGLYAAAYNAVLAWDMARAGTSDPERAHRKITELQHYVMDVYRPQVDAHFDALEREKPPSVRSRSTGTVVDTSDDES